LPRKRIPAYLRSLARSYTDHAINTLAGIAQNGQSEMARVAASCALLDRGWGKAPQAHTAENGEGPIRVVVRHIVRGRDKPLEAKVIDATPLSHEGGDKD
jgi:hypothetical protein